MELLCVCNLSSDSISIIDLCSETICKTIDLKRYISVPIGPHNIRFFEGKLFVANNFSNSIAIYDINNEKFIDNYFVGMHCNDLEVVDDKVYVACGESNYIIVFDLNLEKIIEEIPCGNGPHNVAYDSKSGLIAVSNFLDSSITLINSVDHLEHQNIGVGMYPTKVEFLKRSGNLIVCESFIGKNTEGNLRIIPIKNISSSTEVPVGYSPVDFHLYGNKCFVSNFTEGKVSIINLETMKKIKDIFVGGMPRGILYHKDSLIIGDNFRQNIIRINLKTSKKRIIPIGKEPTGMIAINLQ